MFKYLVRLVIRNALEIITEQTLKQIIVSYAFDSMSNYKIVRITLLNKIGIYLNSKLTLVKRLHTAKTS